MGATGRLPRRRRATAPRRRGGRGETHGVRSRAKDNLLIAGDALHALTSLCQLPELAREYVGKVKLAYLDPPFNTQQAFEHYADALEHSVWLTMMRDWLLQIRKLLSHVTVKSGFTWRYLLVGETDIETARGSWAALKKLGRS